MTGLHECEEDDNKHMVLSSITDKGIRMTGAAAYYVNKLYN